MSFASTDYRQFNYYQRYKWTAQDFTNMQSWTYEAFQGVFEGLIAGSTLSGATITPTSGMSFSVAAGICVSPSGKLMVLTGSDTATLASPAGNPAYSLVVARPVSVGMTPIAKPTDLTQTVNLHQGQSYSITVINGTPSGSPVYPSVQTDDVILMGFRLTTAQSTLSTDNFDGSVRYRLPFTQTTDIISSAGGVPLGKTFTYYGADIQSGVVFQVDGTFVTGNLKVNGTLKISGRCISQY